MSDGKTSETGEYSPLKLSQNTAPPKAMSSRVEVDFGAASHTGYFRPHNEDSYLVARAERSLTTVATNLPAGAIPDQFSEQTFGMGVADGLGGSAAGEVASQTALSTLVNLVLHTPDWIMRDSDSEPERVMNRMVDRYRRIGVALDSLAEGDAELAGMATTMTLGVSNGADLFLTHVGDSRAYLLREGVLFRLTHDHTYAQDLADRGLIRQDEVATHRFHHVLTRTVGNSGSEIDVDVRQLLLRDDDQLLLCTDGLTEMVPNEEIQNLLESRASAAESCEALIEAALAAGGKDNITVVLARYRFPAT